MTKDIVIMAKSTKRYPNYCVAGIDIESGEWVRPVSGDVELEGAVLKEDAIYEDGTEVEVLDVVRIKFIGHTPNEAQSENYLYDSEQYWEKIGKMSVQEVIDKYKLDNPAVIFGNHMKSICEDELTGESLLLLKIQNPIISIKTFNRRKMDISFTYNGIRYKYIRVGDNRLYEKYKRCKDGIYPIEGEKIAVFSLTGKYVYDGKYYKMLAQLF